MTIASEITRLQWAKADIKTSIENKGVSVPSDVKLDGYPPYIDRIVWVDFMNGVKLYNNRTRWVDSNNTGVTTPVSWNVGSSLYGACALVQELYRSNKLMFGIYTFKKTTTGDVVYKAEFTDDRRHSNNGTEWLVGLDVYANWSMVRIFVFGYKSELHYPYYWYCYQYDWDTENNNITTTYLWEVEDWDTNYATYWWDVTWYTQKTWNTWVKSVTPNIINDGLYYYLTLI